MADDPPADATVTVSLSATTLEAIATAVASGIANAADQKAPASSERAKLQADYQVSIDLIKVLTDIRFRCLVFVTAVIAIANALLPGTGDPATRVGLAVVGFITTLGITVYELRNSQLYEAAMARAKVIEQSLELLDTEWIGRHSGLFGDRPPYVEKKAWKDLGPVERAAKKREDLYPMFMRFVWVPVKHDQGLALIYSGALAGWAFLIAYGVLSLPAPTDSWIVPKWWIGVLGAVVGLGTFFLVRQQFVYHDENRFRPGKRREPPAAASARVASSPKEMPSE
jgi:hypothetical protein